VEVPAIVNIILRVIEQDLAPSIMVYFCIMGLGQFYVFAAVFGYLTLLIGGLLVLAYKMQNEKMIRVFRILLVLATFCGFLNIFIDDMIFVDSEYEYLDLISHGP
jgi:hypothetical protein